MFPASGGGIPTVPDHLCTANRLSPGATAMENIHQAVLYIIHGVLLPGELMCSRYQSFHGHHDSSSCTLFERRSSAWPPRHGA
jgi:hypothetical protein